MCALHASDRCRASSPHCNHKQSLSNIPGNQVVVRGAACAYCSPKKALAPSRPSLTPRFTTRSGWLDEKRPSGDDARSKPNFEPTDADIGAHCAVFCRAFQHRKSVQKCTCSASKGDDCQWIDQECAGSNARERYHIILSVIHVRSDPTGQQTFGCQWRGLTEHDICQYDNVGAPRPHQLSPAHDEVG